MKRNLIRRLEHLEEQLEARQKPVSLANLTDEELIALTKETMEAQGLTYPADFNLWLSKRSA